MPSQTTDAGHVPSADVAAYVDGVLSAEEVRHVEAHLADCGDCREEVIAVRRLVHHPPARHRRWSLLAPATIAAAAGLGALLLFRTAGVISSPSEPVTRAPIAKADGAVQTIHSVAPTGIVSPDSVAFIWHQAVRDATYRLSLTAEDGRSVWSGTTSDTVMVLPVRTRLAPSTVYFWHVDALFPDGRSATTGVRRFAIGP